MSVFKFTFNANQNKNTMKKLRSSVARACGRDHIDHLAIMHVITAVEEAYTNICRHAYKNRPGRIELSVSAAGRRIVISMKDWGEPFEPARIRRRSLDELIDNGIEGGLGMMMMERLVDKVRFRKNDDHNEIVLVKNLTKTGNKKTRI